MALSLYESSLASGGVRTLVRGGRVETPAASLTLSLTSALSDIGGGVSGIARRLFLPRGVLPVEYIRFQALDAVQGLCSYLRGVLAMHATFTGLGVGSAESSALAATLVWLLKEGTSHVASLVFAFSWAARLDAEVRWWRLFADVINDVGLTLELAAPLAGAHFLTLTCTANACKALCGVAAGATRVAVSAHFASARGGAHVAEVAAKEGTQETAVTLAGLVGGYFLAPHLNANPRVQWAAFLVLTAVHVAANAAAVRSLALRTLSRTRTLLLLRAAAETGQKGSGDVLLPSPTQLRLVEPLVPVQYFPFEGLDEGVDLRLGCSVAYLKRIAIADNVKAAVHESSSASFSAADSWMGAVLTVFLAASDNAAGDIMCRVTACTLQEVVVGCAGGGGVGFGADGRVAKRLHKRRGSLNSSSPEECFSGAAVKGASSAVTSSRATTADLRSQALADDSYFLLAAHTNAVSGRTSVAIALPAGASPRTMLMAWLAAVALGPQGKGRSVLVSRGGIGAVPLDAAALCAHLASAGHRFLERCEVAGWDVRTTSHMEEDGWRVGFMP